MKNTRQSNINIHRDAWVEINLGNLEYNINSIKEKIKEREREREGERKKSTEYPRFSQQNSKRSTSEGPE